ncbi:MAG: hypothetical protein GC190_12450 [Alphaproteobacteria bacterium]|nr:hypothetical protein [Alphaproteobacteria bacterium]
MRFRATIIIAGLAAIFSAQAEAAEPERPKPCPAVRSIKMMPFRAEHGVDAAYDRLRDDAGCEQLLLDTLTSLKPMADPRQMAPEEGFVEGDAALFVLLERHHLEFEQVLPPEQAEDFRNSGIFAYFAYVATQSGRADVIARTKRLAALAPVGTAPVADMKKALHAGRNSFSLTDRNGKNFHVDIRIGREPRSLRRDRQLWGTGAHGDERGAGHTIVAITGKNDEDPLVIPASCYLDLLDPKEAEVVSHAEGFTLLIVGGAPDAVYRAKIKFSKHGVTSRRVELASIPDAIFEETRYNYIAD